MSEVLVRCMGGEVVAASSIAAKVGPLGLSPKKVGELIAKETEKEWMGIRVTVKVTVENRVPSVSVVPTAAALVSKKIKTSGTLSLGDVIDIAKVMRPSSMAKDLPGTVKEILGTCLSLGCTVDATSPKDLLNQIALGQVLLPIA